MNPRRASTIGVEQWGPIDGYDGYEASNLGKVRSKRGLLSVRKNKGGYPVVSLWQSARKYRGPREVHALMLTAFDGPKPGYVCRHLDGNRGNNILSNLRWGTYAENVQDSRRHGTFHNPPKCMRRGEANTRAKLTEEQVLHIRKRAAMEGTDFPTIKIIASEYGMDPTTIYAICIGRSWSHLQGTSP